MRRREFITVLGGTAITWPLAAHAQQATTPVIGFVNTRSQAEAQSRQIVSALLHGLKEVNFTEGQNVSIEYRWAENRYERLPALVADLVHRQVAVIVANGPAAVAAKGATTKIPIVFYTAGDPVEMGFVTSLNRPEGNLTGVSTLSSEIVSKRIQLLHEVVPTANTIAILTNPKYPIAETETNSMQAAARSLGLQTHVLHASSDHELEVAFAALGQLHVGALAIGPDPFFSSRSEQLGKLALRYAVPAIYQYRAFAAAGGLMSYGISDLNLYRIVGVITGRILKGDKPADIPVQQLTKVELIINLKTAKALGITVPLPLSGRADELIE